MKSGDEGELTSIKSNFFQEHLVLSKDGLWHTSQKRYLWTTMWIFIFIQILTACGWEGLYDDVIKFISEDVVGMYNLKSTKPSGTTDNSDVSDVGTPTIITVTLNDLATIVGSSECNDYFGSLHPLRSHSLKATLGNEYIVTKCFVIKT